MRQRWIARWAFLVLAALATGAALAQGEPGAAAATAQEPAARSPEAPAPDAEPSTPDADPERSATPSVAEAAGAVAGGAREAVEETATALEEGTGFAAREGRGLWSSVLRPLWERFAAGFPSVLKALLLLLAFWLVAVLLGSGVRKLLSVTRIDDRVAEDWGLGGLLKDKDGKVRPIENVAGAAVKWIVLLFGFVAFFQALNLSMVAGPLQGIVDRVVGVVPNLLQAVVILAVYWILASVLRIVVRRGLSAIGFDERASRFLPEREVDGKTLRASDQVGRLLFYVVLVVGLVPFLDALGQRSLVAPLTAMLGRILGFLPNLAAAALIFFVGHLVAVVLREVVTNFLAAAGADGAIRRMELGEPADKLRLSQIAGSVAYFFVIVPILAAAVESLGIRSISDPVSRTLETLLSAVPLLFVAVVVVGVGYFLARIVQRIVQSFLSAVGFDSLPQRLGLEFLASKEPRYLPSSIAGTAVLLVIVLLTAQQALATLGLDQLSELIGRLVAYLPQVLVALVVLGVAWAIAHYVSELIAGATSGRPRAELLSGVARYAILVFGAVLALMELGIGERLLSIAVSALLGGLALALGLAFGLGGQSRAKALIEEAEGK